jgi:predicted transcriptional regulator
MTTPTSISLDDDLKRRVQRLADTRLRPVDWLMHEAIEQYVEREEKREALNQDTPKGLGGLPSHRPSRNR